MYNFNIINNCNICGSNIQKHKYIGKRYNRSQGFFFKKKLNDIHTNIYKCKVCKTIFSNPLPIPVKDFERYENLHPNQTNQMLNFDKNIFDYELSIINKYFNNKKLKFLDIGCGNGYLLNKLYKKNFDVYGLEPVKKFFDVCINSFPHLQNKVENMPIENFNFGNKEFDIISFNSVLEHLINPSMQIKLLLNNLADNGIIHIEVPSSNWLISKLINFFKLLTIQNNVTNLSPMHHPYHYFEFSYESFKLNGINNGYKVINHYYRVSEVDYKIPLFCKKILKFIMKKTNTGKQIVVFLKKL